VPQLILAWRQFDLSRKQDAMSGEQLEIAKRQLDVSKRQDEIMVRQDKMAAEQLDIAKAQLALSARQDEITGYLFAQRPDLRLVINDRERDAAVVDLPSGVQLRVAVLNAGDKSINEFYCHIYVPFELQPAFTGVVEKHIDVEIKGVRYSWFRCHLKESIFPKRVKDIGTLSLKGVPKNYKLIWEFGTEAGSYKGAFLLKPLKGLN